MKYLLILGLVLLAVWLWRHNRIAAARQEQQIRKQQEEALKQQVKPPLNPPMLAVDIVACAYCNVHIPQPDALVGPDNRWYCGAVHLQNANRKKR